MKEAFDKLKERLEKEVFVAELYGGEWNGQTVENLLCLGNVVDVISEVEAEYGNGWIPCSERLPKVRQDCLVTVKYSGFLGMHGFWVKTGHMEAENDWCGDCFGGTVIAWMPLPEPYKPEK